MNIDTTHLACDNQVLVGLLLLSQMRIVDNVIRQQSTQPKKQRLIRNQALVHRNNKHGLDQTHRNNNGLIC